MAVGASGGSGEASGEGDACKGEPGRTVPVVDRNRCEAKADCVRVCPYDVFEVRQLDAADRAMLSLRGRIKAWAHRGLQAYAARANACHACGECVVACPEGAITLRSVVP
jgi:NAD-dependent dihydropyrimidine dehydrogenase PreA subunit